MSEASLREKASVESLVARVADEFLERQKNGEKPDIEEYAARYPEAADLLRKVLASLELIGLSQLSGFGSSATGTEPAGTLGDFRIVREVGRGGMGVVYEAEQISLRRRVALKVLPFAATMDPRHLQRFHNEAQAAACLHHTNIVPVYFVGSERSVHFYAMQFIDGQPLSEIIRQMQHAEKKAPTAGEAGTVAYQPSEVEAASTRPVAEITPLTGEGRRGRDYYRKVAELGIQAAEALDHAHQLGIVHRDIKPGNLMLDGRGNLWVTDFGLAHVQHSEASLTLTGQALGTPRYMSPEQALAKRVSIDHRTDVYSLGATLYELLTLRPAFGSEDRQELLRQIAVEEPARLRRLERAIPAELETIVLKAMEKNPTDRYGTAQELADDLERFLNDEPIQARRPPLWLRLRKWGRRHRPLVASLAAGMLMLLVVGMVLALGYQRRLMETEKGVTAALLQVEILLEEGDKLIDHPERWQATARLALSAQERAEALLAAGAATAPLRKRVEKDRAVVESAIADSGLLIELNRIRIKHAALKEGRFNLTETAPSYAKALGDYGVDLAAPESSGERIRGSRIREALVAALEDWWRVTDEKEGERLEQVLQAVDPADASSRARWWEAAHRNDDATLLKMAMQLPAERLPAAVVCSRAADLQVGKQWAAAERLLKAAQLRHPGDFWLNYDLAMGILKQGPTRTEEAVGYLRAALANRSDNPDAMVLSSLGAVLSENGKFDDAIAFFRRATEVDPKWAGAHFNLGLALHNKGKPDEAIVWYQRAIELDPKYVGAQSNLGVALMNQGRLDEAIRCYKLAINIDPKSAIAHKNLGDATNHQGKLEEAIAWYQRAIELDPKLYDAHNNLGAALSKQGQLDAAIDCFKNAINSDPKQVSAHNNLGVALKDQGRVDEAIAEYYAAIKLDKNFAAAHYNLGLALQDKGQFGRAIDEYSIALRLKPDYADARNELAACRNMLDADRKLPGILAGKTKPVNEGERIALGYLCGKPFKRLYAAAVSFYTEAFAAQPKLAEDLNAQHRYCAGCCAALAGCGQGKDADKLDANERARLRQQALDWLRVDLKAYRQMMEKDTDKAGLEIAQRMKNWLLDEDFAGVRGDKALAKLPEEERAAWRKLWADVAELLAKAQGKAPAEKKADTK